MSRILFDPRRRFRAQDLQTSICSELHSNRAGRWLTAPTKSKALVEAGLLDALQIPKKSYPSRRTRKARATTNGETLNQPRTSPRAILH